MADDAALVWFRRDLRDFDQAALQAALQAHEKVHCAFVFDTDILGGIPLKANRRVTFLWECVRELKASLEAKGGGLHLPIGPVVKVLPDLARQLGVSAVYANRDYEPQAIERDRQVVERLAEDGIDFRTRKDQVIFELSEVRTKTGGDFSVFTPYKNAWLAMLQPHHVAARDVESGFRFARVTNALPSLHELGFTEAAPGLPTGMSGGAALWKDFAARLSAYGEQRDFPALNGTSRLSAHLRFGTVSIRQLVKAARARRSAGAQTWLSELIWRDFYSAVLTARPDVVRHSFRAEYDALQWETDEALFRAWQEGRTGYPLVDAAMRELKATGAMHNRLRMVTASFLTKDLGFDWRRGADHFAEQLLDHDLASNNGGWQWSASTGCDAQPWFRLFNPVMQSARFDPEGLYIRRWLPELKAVPEAYLHAPWEMPPPDQQAVGVVIGRDYPTPIVRHDEARQRTLARYGAIKARAPVKK